MRVLETKTGFCEVYDAPEIVIRYLQLSVPSIMRYYTDDPVPHWRVYEDFILHTVQLGYCELGHVDYKGLGTKLQMAIAKERPNWVVKDQKKKASVKKAEVVNKFEAYATLFLTPDAPGFIIDAVWKALALKHHPDRGGDSEAFKTFSVAYEKIKRK